MSKSLYEEAVAEAKQLKEVAEKNAKNAIIEAVTPKIRQFIEQQLVGDDEEKNNEDALTSVVSDMFSESDSEYDDDVVLSEDAISSLLELIGGDEDNQMSGIKGRSSVAHALKESLDLMSESEREKILHIAHKLKLKADNFHTSSIVMEEDNILIDLMENQDMSRHDDEILYDVDLRELVSGLSSTTLSEGRQRKRRGLDEINLNELDLILTGLPDELRDQVDLSQLAVEFGEEEEVEEVEFEEDFEEEEVEGPEGGEFEEEEEEEEEEVTEEPLGEVFDVNVDMLYNELQRFSEGKDFTKIKGIKNDMADQWGGKGDGKAGPKHQWGGKGQGKVDAFGGGSRKGDPLNVKLNVLKETLKKESRKNRALKSKLNEYASAIESLREQLTEMNLFNAKLLYVNKLLQNKGASSSQKRAIIEALDGARSLREVKLLYRSLTNSIGQSKSGRTLSESAVRRSLGSSSRTVSRSTPSSSETTEVKRWAKLAGIE